ncbi:MAG: efflux RND transporter permease subunit [Clostridiaceae bacterium]|nr:efflux RND transporter permease subunit [Clostridiaceae bacterium]
MPKFSVKRPFVVLVGVVMILVLGYVSFTRMTTDFLPNMNMPYMLVITTYPGASPEKVEAEVSEALENTVGTVNGVANVTSVSSENYSMISLEFEDDTDMDAAMVKVSSAVNQTELPDNTGTPMIMQISADMMSTMMTSVDCEGKSGYELSKFIEDNIVPELERQDGVASVDISGLVEKSIEVRLNQDKIDDVNAKVLEKANDTLAKARRKLEKAEAKLQDGKEELSKQKEELQSQQDEQSGELAKYSKLMNEAIATKQAQTSELTSLQANQAALKAEKQAYEDNGVVSSYQQLNQGFHTLRKSMKAGGELYQSTYQAIYDQILIAVVQAQMDAAGTTVTVTSDNVDTYLSVIASSGGSEAETAITEEAAKQAKTQTKQQMSETLQTIPSSVRDAIRNPEKLTAYKSLLKSQGQTKAAKQMTKKNLKSLYQINEVRIPQIKTALGNLKTEIAVAKNVLAEVEKAIQSAEDKYEEVEQGKITAAAAFGSASAQLSSAESTLESSEKELEEGKESFNKSKKEALKNANLDELLTKDQLASILTAENFSMPAGYISEDGTQYLIKVGEEYDSVDAMKDTVLCELDDIGDVCLSDVADVTVIDNAGDSYGRVNGNDAVLLSISKSSTAGTSDVSNGCNEKLAELEEKYDGFHYMNLMDQGEYIELIVDSVLSNLLWGALLAIIVLFLFLRDVRPTVIVAFSIPLSVLFAIVLMYFTNITLNIISLSGLALGVGMLVDNSIVVIENIYRLRGKGVPAARAAVMGANQMAGAIFSSTLTTICVFLPIVFTDGITRQIMQDMCLTIAYSLGASLFIALTLVPCMGATTLKHTKERKHRWFDAVVTAYGRVLRFCLRFKVVPVAIAGLLLVFSVWKVTQMGIVFIPSMGSDQMSASLTMDAEASTEEDYELADQIAGQIEEIEGVNTVGAMKGSSGVSLGSTSDKEYTFMLLLDEDYANQNKEIAAKIETIFEENGCEEYSVSESNMDMSSLMSSGLEVDIYGKDTDKLIEISEDVMDMVAQIKGFDDISNGQEEGDRQISVKVDKDKAMRLGLTVAQVYSELSDKLTTEKDSTTLSVGDDDYDVVIVDERDELDTDNLLDYEFETTTTDEEGNTETKTHKLKEFAEVEDGTSVASISRENLVNYIQVTAETQDGYNTTLLSRDLQTMIDDYELPAGYEITVGGETETNMEMVSSMITMIMLAIVLIYLIMVAQFQGLLSPFIVLLTIPLAFTGGFLALLITGEQLSVMALMGFLVLAGVVVNNGIVFVDYTNKLRLNGSEKRDALVEAGQTRMRPIFMTALTTILAMSTLAFSTDSTAAMSRGMAIVTIGGLSYATLMTLFIVPVFYDIFYRRKIKEVDLGDEETLNEVDDII